MSVRLQSAGSASTCWRLSRASSQCVSAIQRSRGRLPPGQEFGDKPGVIGLMVTSPRFKPVHDNAYMKTYKLIEEMGLPMRSTPPIMERP